MSTLDVWQHALVVMATVAAPFLVVALVVGLAVALIQTATQLQESVLAFVPKLAAAFLVMALAGHWAFERLTTFATSSFERAADRSGEDREP
ncbi:MAG TPA: flagellar biosynthetic protein FliQ [Kofleriaceae bacterium]|nr:flagellar biosynthetic protein FliQ [Kofleriaceae bacterium]